MDCEIKANVNLITQYNYINQKMILSETNLILIVINYGQEEATI
jgi:hypothetical protein